MRVSWSVGLNSFLKIALILSVAAGLGACKPRNSSTAGSRVQSDISFGGQTIGLDSYIANSSDHAAMRQEFATMAQTNNGKPNYGDGEYKIRNILKPVFSTVPGYSLVMEEQVALLVWSVGNKGENAPYERINGALRSPTVTDDAAVDSTVKVLSSAVNKLAGRPCNAVRGVGNLPSSYLSLRAGETFKDNGFVAFGMGNQPPVPFNASPIWIYVYSPKCKIISQFSKYGGENEALFPPGTDFSVQSNQNEGGRRVFRLTHSGGPNPEAPAGNNGGVQPPAGNDGVNPPPQPPPGADDGAGGGLTFQSFVGKRYRDTAGRTLWLNAGRACTAKRTGTVQNCTWEFAGGHIAVTFADNTAWHYKASSAAEICFVASVGAACSGTMTAYTP